MGREERVERFKRVAGKRTNIILRALKSLSKCSEKKNYEYTQQQTARIFRAIEDELRYTRMQFRQNRENKFTLD